MKRRPADADARLRIDAVAMPGTSGLLGMTHCPGRRDPVTASGDWRGDLRADLQIVRKWGASTIVSLLEASEFELLGVPDFEVQVTAAFRWLWLPIHDGGVPDAAFEARWHRDAPELQRRLAGGERLLIHCRAGLGRTGLATARLLIEAGLAPAEAIRTVRAARPGAIETRAQERYLLRLR